MFFRKRAAPNAQPEWLIVGLGNPGTAYEGTRHNVGARAAETLAKRHGVKLNIRRFRARYGLGEIAGLPVAIALPMTYMNLSGEAVRALLSNFHLDRDRLVVVSDEMALPLGALRLRLQGSAGGQKGVESIIQRLGSNEFARLRIGIDRPPPGLAVDYVLSRFDKNEQPLIDEAMVRAAEALEMLLSDGPERAMAAFNRSGDAEP